MGVCLATATVAVALATQSFTLAWTHSIEKLRWEEDWRVEGEALVLEAARVRGSGAGMEAGPGAVLRDGAWEWQPRTSHAVLRLTRSGFTPDYQWCMEGRACTSLGELLPSDGAVTEVRACRLPERG